MYIAIIDPTDLSNEFLENKLSSSLKEKVILQRDTDQSIVSSLINKYVLFDLVLLGEKLETESSVSIAKFFREKNFNMPILQMTKVSEAKLTFTEREAGIDDTLNIVELDLPTFPWTLLSVLKSSEIRKKADEFDTIRNNLAALNTSLTSITHDINNPLGVIRLAIFQLQNQNLTEENKNKYIKMVNDNLDKIEVQISNIRMTRTKIKNDQTILSKIIIKT